MLYSRDQQFTYTCGNIFNTIKTSRYSSLEKYTPLTLFERVVCERWVGDWTKLQHIDPPQLFWLQQHFFPVLLGCSTGGLGAQSLLGHGSHFSIFSPTDWTSCRRGYIIIWHPPTSCERHNSHSIQHIDSQGYPPVSSTGCTCYLYRCISYLTARPDRRSICNKCNELIN